MAAPDKDAVYDQSLQACTQFIIEDKSRLQKVVVPHHAEGALSTSLLPFRDIGRMKKVYTLFDVHESFPFADSDAERMVDEFITNGPESLPEALRPRKVLPPQCRNITLQLYVHKVADGRFDVVKAYSRLVVVEA